MTTTPASLPDPSACARCGACTAVCPVFRATGRETYTARGKLHLLQRLDAQGDTAAMAAVLAHCLLCGACGQHCPRGMAPHLLFEALRTTLTCPSGTHAFLATLARSTMARPRLAAGIAGAGSRLFDLLPATSGLRLRLQGLGILPETRLDPIPEQASDAAATLNYFSGCLARHLRRDIDAATRWSANRLCGHVLTHPESQVCCGLAALAAGDRVQAADLARANIESFAGNDLPILTSCASCYSHLRRYPEILAGDRQWQRRAESFAGRLREYSSLLCSDGALTRLPGLAQTAVAKIIVYHDPCHLRFHQKVTSQPRSLLGGLPGVLLRELPSGPRCCGQGGMFHLTHAATAAAIRGPLIDDFLETGAGWLLSSCSGCLLHLRQAIDPARARVVHPAVFLAEHFG